MERLMSSSRAAAVHVQLVAACRAMRNAEHTVCVLLREVLDDELHLEHGYASAYDYAVHALGLEERKAYGLLQLARALPRLPELDRAPADGRLGWTKARDMLRVLTPENEAAWVERAANVDDGQLLVELARRVLRDLEPEDAPTGERRKVIVERCPDCARTGGLD